MALAAVRAAVSAARDLGRFFSAWCTCSVKLGTFEVKDEMIMPIATAGSKTANQLALLHRQLPCSPELDQ